MVALQPCTIIDYEMNIQRLATSTLVTTWTVHRTLSTIWALPDGSTLFDAHFVRSSGPGIIASVRQAATHMYDIRELQVKTLAARLEGAQKNRTTRAQATQLHEPRSVHAQDQRGTHRREGARREQRPCTNHPGACSSCSAGRPGRALAAGTNIHRLRPRNCSQKLQANAKPTPEQGPVAEPSSGRDQCQLGALQVPPQSAGTAEEAWRFPPCGGLAHCRPAG